jgi:SAM-dependent methyltransferase
LTEAPSFPDALRSEYDPEVLDVGERTKRAARLHAALSAVGLWPGGVRILDMGCGSGLLLNALGTETRQRVGCDARRSLYLQVREQAGSILFTQCEGHRLPFRNGCFDLVTCLAVIGELPDWQSAVEEMARCVAPGGVLYITVANGRFLLLLYSVAERFGRRIRVSWREYARASLPMTERAPEQGLGVDALAGWRYVHLTPHLARSQWPWLRLVPLSLLDWLVSRVAPSFGFAWQRPRMSSRGTDVAAPDPLLPIACAESPE